jgi:hypothetical protein
MVEQSWCWWPVPRCATARRAGTYSRAWDLDPGGDYKDLGPNRLARPGRRRRQLGMIGGRINGSFICHGDEAPTSMTDPRRDGRSRGFAEDQRKVAPTSSAVSVPE